MGNVPRKVVFDLTMTVTDTPMTWIIRNCKQLFKNGTALSVTCPRYYGIDCDICSHGPEPGQQGCRCHALFDDSKQQMITTTVTKRKLQDKRKAKKDRAPSPEKTTASTLMNFALEER